MTASGLETMTGALGGLVALASVILAAARKIGAQIHAITENTASNRELTRTVQNLHQRLDNYDERISRLEGRDER